VTRRRLSLAVVCALRIACARAAGPETVTILRDAYGVPHLFNDGPGARLRGAYANGYAQAEDRLFEMDVLRRVATGRLAATQGASYLPMDEVARRDGFTRDERARIFHRLPLSDRRQITAFRDGVNAFIHEVTVDPQRLPFEFLGTPPALWDETDTVAVAVLEFVVFGANGGQEVLNAALLLDLLDRFPDAEARGIFDDLFWLDDPAAPTTIVAADGAAAAPDDVERFAGAQLDLVRAHAASIRQAAAELRAEQGLMGGLGAHRHASNAIVVGPALSATGAPILLGGPQTGLDIPNLFWEVGLHGGGYEAEGVIGPAGPGVLIGRGRNFAMTITSGMLDNVDTYVETIDPANPDRYLFRGRSLPFDRRMETFQVSGAADVTTEVLRTVHGPVFFIDRPGGVAFSRRAAFRGEELASAAAIVHVGFVHDLKDFRRLADRVAVSLNLHYADASGNIAYFHRGLRPLRARHTDPRLPFDGRGTMEWRGRAPSKDGPSVVNPTRGYVTNWNNKPIAGWSAGEQRELWGVVDRVQVFVDALDAAKASATKLGTDDVNALMRRAATSDIFAARVVPFLEAAVSALGQPPGDPLPAAVALVHAWIDAGAPLVAAPAPDGTLPFPGAAIYRAFRAALQDATFGDELGTWARPMFYPAANVGDAEDDHGSLFSPDALLLRALFQAGTVPGATPPAGLLPLSRSYFDDVGTSTHHTRDDALAAALQAAVDALGTQFGTSDETQWRLPGLLDQYRDLGAVDLVFSVTTTPRQNRGSFNLLVDLGTGIHGRIVVPPGEGGTFTNADVHAEPAHLRDQLPVYTAFTYRTQPFTAAELQAPVTMETVPVVRP
jgi:penicillin amidase